MASNLSLISTDSDDFDVEQSVNNQSIPTPNTPIVLKSTEISGDDAREMISSPQSINSPNILNSTEISQAYAARMSSVSSIASAKPQFFTIDDNSNKPTIPYGFGRQLPIVPPSLNDLNLPPNPFNILATMAIANNTEDANNNNYSPESTEPSEPSPISTPPMNVSAINRWETSYTTTDDDTFHSIDEPRKIYFFPPSPSPPPSPPRRRKRRVSLGMSFPKEGGVSQHICEACGQTMPSTKDIPGPSNKD